MPLVPVTAFYVALLALLLLALAMRVIRLRWKLRVGIGDGGDRIMIRAVRAHGNAAEHVPIALLLLFAAELNHAGPLFLHACGAVLVGSRVLHAIGLTRSGGPSWPRTVGTVGTMAVVIVLAVRAITGFFH